MIDSLDGLLRATPRVGEPGALFDLFRDYLKRFGIEVVSYHVLRQGFERLSLRESYRYHSFPDDWTRRYIEQDYFKDDAIMHEALREPHPFRVFDIEERGALTVRQLQFFEDLRAVGITDGLAVPVHGFGGSVAFFGLGVRGGSLDVSQAETRELQYACHHVHTVCSEALAPDEGASAALSPRESEVLHWAARGKSNTVIAQILGLSDHTVDTLMRRSFQKLGVTNRISAVLKGIGSGIILP